MNRKQLLLGSVALAATIVCATHKLGAAPQAHHDDFSLATSLHGIGIEINDHHVGVGPGGGCVHDATVRLLGPDGADFRYRVTAPDMPTAHATSLVVAVGIVAGQSPAQVVGALNQAGFGVEVRVDKAGAIPPGPPQLVARLVDLLHASIDVVSDRPGGGCEGLEARVDSGLVALGFAGSCVVQACQGPNCVP